MNYIVGSTRNGFEEPPEEMPKKNPHAVSLGRKGGKSTSPAKQAAVRANVAKARKVRALKPICGRCEKVHSNKQLNICDDGIASGDQRDYVSRKAKQEKNNELDMRPQTKS